MNRVDGRPVLSSYISISMWALLSRENATSGDAQGFDTLDKGQERAVYRNKNGTGNI